MTNELYSSAGPIEGRPTGVRLERSTGGAEAWSTGPALPAAPLSATTLKISVIIPCFNAADTIAAQLSALARQSWTGWWELVVVDNGSTDNSDAVVTTWVQRLGFPRWRLIRAQQRRGAAYARNVGAEHAVGDVLAFADADDEAGEGWLEAVADAMLCNELIGSRLEYDKLNAPRIRNMRGLPQQDGLQLYRRPDYLNHATGAGLAVRRQVHQRLGGFNEDMRLLEDTDYCWRAQLAGVRISFAPAALMHYRLRPTVRGGCSQARQWAQYNARLYLRYRGQGMGPHSVWMGARQWWRLVLRCPELFDAQRRPRWLWDINWAVGRLYGAIKHRILR